MLSLNPMSDVLLLILFLLIISGVVLWYHLATALKANKKALTEINARREEFQSLRNQFLQQSLVIFAESDDAWVVPYPPQKLLDLLKVNFKENLCLLDFATDKQREPLLSLSRQLSTTDEGVTRELSLRNSEGTEIYFEIWARRSHQTIQFFLTDITSKFRYNALLQRLQIGAEKNQFVCISNREGIITYANAAFCEQLNTPCELLLGKSLHQYIDDRHSPELMISLNPILQRGQCWEGEICYRAQNGAQHWVQSSIYPLIDKEGSPKHYLHIGQNITPQKNLIHQLRLQRLDAEALTQRMQSLVNSSLDGIIVINAKGIILEFNPSCEKIFGYTREEVLGQLMSEHLIPARFRKKHKMGLEKLLGTLDALFSETTLQVNALRKGGGEFPMEISIFKYIIQGQVFFGGFLRDITTKKIADISLKSSMHKLEIESKLWNMIDEIQEILAHGQDDNNTIKLLLKSIGENLSWDLVQIYQTTANISEERAFYHAYWVKTENKHNEFIEASQKIIFNKETGIIGKAWSTKSVTWIADIPNNPEFIRNQNLTNLNLFTGLVIPIIVYGEVQYIIEAYTESFLMEDPNYTRALKIIGHLFANVIKKKLLAERESQVREEMANNARMSTLGELSSGIAHEINNPLMVLSGQAKKAIHYLQLPQQNPLEAEIALKKIVDHASRIAKIIHGLRLFSRDDSHDEFLEFSVSTLVDDSLEICKPALAQNKIQLFTHAIDSTLSIECKPGQISQVLVNLIQNANDAISELNERWIKLEIVPEEEMVEFRITDSGKGIPSSLAEKVFSPFFTTKPVGKGTGLGLSISKGIIETHKGLFMIDTTQNNTCFVFKLPKKQKHSQVA